MSWNYRIVKTEKGHGLFEVYYEDTGKPRARSLDPVLGFYYDKPSEIVETIDLIKSSLKKHKEVLPDDFERGFNNWAPSKNERM